MDVTLRNGVVVEVRELDWFNAIDFITLVATDASALVKAMGRTKIDATDTVALIIAIKDAIPTAATMAKGASEFLLRHAVASELPQGGLGAADTMKVLQAALKLNLSAEVLEAAESLGKTLAEVSRTLTGTPPRS